MTQNNKAWEGEVAQFLDDWFTPNSGEKYISEIESFIIAQIEAAEKRTKDYFRKEIERGKREVAQQAREEAVRECVEVVNEIYEKAMADFSNREHGSPDLNVNGAIQVGAIQRCLFELQFKLTPQK